MKKQPNILFIMSDDHAAHAISCYGSKINKTPNLDRIANEGVRLENCFCTNSICTPSRASILTGTYNHINEVTTLGTPMDNSLQTFPKILKEAGYQTAVYGKWHLGEGERHNPTGFDDWAVVPGQGYYFNPTFIMPTEDGGATKKMVEGYATDIITDMTLNFLKNRDTEKPFCVLYHHKAPHRPWYSDEKHAHLFLNEDVPEPDTLFDEYENRSDAAKAAAMRVGVDMNSTDLKCEMPNGMTEMEQRRWAYQRYIKDYLRVIQSVDDNVGRVLDYLKEAGLEEDTIVIYTSDQGFFLGDHGWYDKRFMYEESLRMPFMLRYPREVKPGSVNSDLILNVDFASYFLDMAGIPIPEDMQGHSFRKNLQGSTAPNWREGMYYRYWMNETNHNVAAHYGIRTHQYKLIYYYYDGCGQKGTEGGFCAGKRDIPSIKDHEPEWELFDLAKDPQEMNNVVNDPAYANIVAELKDALHRLQKEVKDERFHKDVD